MTLYFFDVTGHRPVADRGGEMLAGIAEARGAAVQVLAEILPMHRADLESGQMVGVAVRNEQGEVVWTIETRSGAAR